MILLFKSDGLFHEIEQIVQVLEGIQLFQYLL